ncbi:PREDICTED: uncharacterized protein LOC109581814 isoform X2 [Amphimedon queenslandica]|uniref:Uncharacterized protein n=1 Tax=Amphimedon queenslandica TaxID=400682 RepID=A0A1X7UWK1_AMPQE|nr:PREDICTED: uncharacterized protein LOC109581814 isoform X2 [Amphimedon queenslandica]|eukprot:XP_019851779.1 PREDICTED: uncharacterized protein LOC109581814 isoform X2 [Amphimedon queenslandica]
MAFVMMIETASQIHTATQNVMSSLYSNWKYMALAAIVIAIVTLFMIYNAFVLKSVESPNEVVVEGFNFPERPPPPPPVGDEPADAGNDNQQVINGGENPGKQNNNENKNNPEVQHSGIIRQDIDKKDQATPLEKTSPKILASISNTQEEHEYMILPIEVKKGKIDKSLWVVNYPYYPGTCKCLFPGYCEKDFTSDLSQTDNFDVKKLHV